MCYIVKPFQSRVAFYIKTSHLFRFAKPVICFSLQNEWLVYIWNAKLDWNGLTCYTLNIDMSRFKSRSRKICGRQPWSSLQIFSRLSSTILLVSFLKTLTRISFILPSENILTFLTSIVTESKFSLVIYKLYNIFNFRCYTPS